MLPGAARIAPPPAIDVVRGCDSFDADDVEMLDVVLGDVEIVAASRFAAHLPKLGVRPTMIIGRRYAGGGGEGRIRVTSVPATARREVFPALRKLRTESNWASAAAARNLLHGHVRKDDGPKTAQLVEWLKDVKRGIRQANHGEASPLPAERSARRPGVRHHGQGGQR